ncbi:MAG: HPP family protein [Deltaproteobacteria bacterium]|nr:HPP family protein [Deltaproteobacteria bacterium]
MRGSTRSPPRVRPAEVLWSWVGAFLGIGLVGYLDQHLFAQRDAALLIGSFGASAVLVYGAVRSPLAQPRNVLGGHLVSAVIGVASYQLLRSSPWLAAAVAVATAIAAMHLTRTLHPPGGATALIAVIGGPKIHSLGYLYALVPAGLGAVLLLAVGLLVNNLARERSYPEFWA